MSLVATVAGRLRATAHTISASSHQLFRQQQQQQQPQTQVRFATKKAGGSTKNGRDSAGRRLGVKIFGGQEAKAGAIIIRQRGRKFYAGDNVGMGNDHTIYSKVLGLVKFTNHPERKRKVVNVVPY